jgi:hypothetical protein
MRTKLSAAVALLAWTCVAQAQQDIEWKQIINVPKGEYIPRESADMLGLEIGDSYAEIKAKLEKLANGSPVKESKTVFRFQLPGASTIVTASYIGKAELERVSQGTSGRNVRETITAFFSAPSSGQQLVGLSRGVEYFGEADQPRVSEVLGMLKSKMKGEPQIYPLRETTTFYYVFNKGRLVAPKPPGLNRCAWHHTAQNASVLPQINTDGECDAALLVGVNHGLSRDHAKSINFQLFDNERLKATATADYRYVEVYIKDLQARTRGAPPKL